MNTNRDQRKSLAVHSTLAAVVTALLLWLVASTMDYDDATREQAEYCQNVRDGLRPDFKGIYDKVCEEEL